MRFNNPVSAKSTHARAAMVACMAVLALMLAFAGVAAAKVVYLPDVTKEMCSGSYWSAKDPNASEVLADRAAIDQLNQDGIDADGTMLQPLKEARAYYYDKDQQTTLKNSARTEINSVFVGQVYDEDDNLVDQAYADEIIANYPEDGSEPDLASPYGIVTTHTTMRCYPTDKALMYTQGDYDDDNLYLASLRVNEPVLIREASVDGQFLLCISSCMSPAWVPAKDVAICEDKDEWLEAWDIPAGQELVVTGYKVRTEQSRVTPNTADRMLYMGTTLERVDLESPEEAVEVVGTESAFNRYVCYLPVRNDDGTYARELALIAESAQVSEGFLPLTTKNIEKVAFNSLGQMYGWGGMLEANDCSGYMRDIYKCFGFELARNTNWQMNMPVRHYELSGMDDAHKAAAIAQMPLGTILYWGGHEMMYLGQEDGKLYVISATGSIGDVFGEEYTARQVKGVIVNTLDMVRGNRGTWLQSLTWANMPWVSSSDQGTGMYDVAFYDASITWPDESYVETNAAIEPDVTIPGLTAGADYTVSFENNVKPGTATVTVKGAGDYSGEISKTFEILPSSIASAKVKVKNMTYTGKKLKPAPTVKLGKVTLKKGADYTMSYKDNKNAGTATVTVKGAGRFTDSVTKTFTIKKAAQKITAKNVSKTYKLSKKTKRLAKTKTINLKKLAGVSAKTAVTFKKASKDGGIHIAVNAKTGKLKAYKGLKKGTYKVKVKLTAAANANYKKAKAKTITVKIVVK
ncbi:MAG: NlpC/P60 family protein [Coriobacteriia bacterium]|nr:NlpC/P60 family protein [Coriobacteriia bacterium]